MVFAYSPSQPVQPVSRRPLTQEEFNEFKGELGEFLTDYFSKKAQQQEKKEVDLKIAAQQHAAKAKMHAERADALDAQVEKMDKDFITLVFYRIFYPGKNVPEGESDNIYKTYLADKSCSVEEKDGKSFPRLNNMIGVVQYLKDHSNLQNCDFRQFKSEIVNIDALVKHIETTDKIKAIGFMDTIPKEMKAVLGRVEAAKKGVFKVRYFPPKPI